MNAASGAARRRRARKKYKPDLIRFLLVAEAPPSEDRYFYFDDVTHADNLFVGTMKILFPDRLAGYVGQRTIAQKRNLLKAFQNEGFWLLDAVDSPLEHAANVARIQQISDLERRLSNLRRASEIDGSTPVIFMKANVYRAFHERLRTLGFNAIDQLVYFPGNGRQPDFQVMFPKALKLAGYRKGGRHP